MGKREDVSMMRLTDEAGQQFVAACVGAGSCDLLCIGEPDSWTEGCDAVTSIVFNTSGTLQLTDPKDLDAMSAWIAAAAIWLRMAQHGGDDANDELLD